MPGIFISYSHIDREFVHRLAQDLRHLSVEVWLDQYVRPGGRWDLEIRQALNEASGYIVVLSPDSVRSERVLEELSIAQGSGKKVYPVLYRNAELPSSLTPLQWVDFRGDYEQPLLQLVSGIRGLGHRGQSVADVAARSGRYRSTLLAISEWLHQQPPDEMISSWRLGRDLRTIAADELAACLMILVREGLLHRKFCLMLDDGRLTGDAFTSIQEPARAVTGSRVSLERAELIPVFERTF